MLLDACVIIPASLNDTLLRAAAADYYRVYWTEDILAEVQRNLIGEGLTTEEGAARRLTAMGDQFPEALVAGYQEIIAAMTNDPKDRHVLAAAVIAGAQVIVTSNLRNFPDDSVEPFGIAALSPDDFLLNLFALYSAGMATIIRDQAADLRQPPMTMLEVLADLAQHAPVFAGRVRDWIA